MNNHIKALLILLSIMALTILIVKRIHDKNYDKTDHSLISWASSLWLTLTIYTAMLLLFIVYMNIYRYLNQ